ncbi:hypothetical protein G9272_16965 [Streptomyces asoensis]|uniref:Uncharacterized protein n=1 Tax=Streptomyces asoensis TaxID=249586 RepID=A0A6M4WPZ2_9ACTN|nr:hypothetical protein [Streptomyces asoensis]QJT01791.1 hypothetical protein G9272_16965 [Streptomyces asoensis]
MAFPQTPLDIQADLKIGGVWQNITADVFTRDLMTIIRGRPDEGSRSDPGKLKLTLNNGRSKVNPAVSGRYSDGNPLSDLYGYIGRNTPVRVHLPASTSHLELDGDPAGYVSTPHVAALNITGDLDVRAEFDADMTLTAGNLGILGKWGTVDADRSWFLRYFDGNITFIWLDSGALVHSTNISIERYGGAVLRVTLDVDNGASGHTVRFYQGDTITGPWTQLFTDIVGAGTTSLQSTTSALRIGPSDASTTPPRTPFVGNATRFQVRSGIDGTLVADADFRPLAHGAAGFTDSVGRVWTVNGTATVRKRSDRMVGEISTWPPRWDVSGNDRWVPVEAAGILRRLGQGAAALQSPLRRRIPAYSPLAYWPLEEGAQATRAYSPIPGVAPLTLTGVNWAANSDLISSGPLPVWAAGTGPSAVMQGTVPAPAGATTGWQVAWVYRLDTPPPTTLRTIMRINTTGTVREWRIQSKDSQSKIFGVDIDGNTVVDQGIGTSNNIFGTWVASHFRVSESGGTVTYTVVWSDIHGSAGSYTNTVAATAGRVTNVGSPPGGFSSELDGMAMGHIAVFGTTTTSAYTSALDAWTPEYAGQRMVRLGSEENVPVSVRGVIADQEEMGAQRMLTLLELFGECGDSDGGILMEHRSRPSLRYRGRTTMYNQSPALTLSYTTDGEIAPPLEPIADDADVNNDVTVTRIDGSSARVVLEDGPLSVQAPPDGIGRYDTSVQRSLATDEQAGPIAGWLLHLGTWDAPRYPVVHVDLAAAPHLADAVMAVDQGDVIRLTDLPADVPPGDVDLIVQGYSESFDQYGWDWYAACTPAAPWTVGVVGDTNRGRADTAGTVLAAAATSTATALHFLTTAQQRWVTTAIRPGAFPFDVRLGGEVVTATAITPWLNDLFSRTVSNGWGSPNSGPAWTVVGGSASDFSVGSGYGTQLLATVDVSRRVSIPAVHADFDMYCDVSTSATATGDSLYAAPTARMLDSDNMYMARVAFTTANAATVVLRKLVAGVGTDLGTYTVPGYTHTAGAFIRLRFQATGSALRVKAWPATQAEPDVWHIAASDTSITAANSFGTRSIRVTGNTNGATAAIRYANFIVVNPQTVTATRSVNGIVKAQTAGTGVRLATPCIVPL